MKSGIRDQGLEFKMIIGLILSLNFSGCLFMRPFTPSARLMPENQVSTTLSGGYNNYSMVRDDNYYVYGDYVYNPDLGYYEYVEGHDVHETFTEQLSAISLDLGWRTRVAGTDLEIGFTVMNILNLGMDFTYSFSDPATDPVLVALNMSIYGGLAPGPSYGFSSGLVTNVPINKKGPSDLVFAAYYQFFHNSYLTGLNYSYNSSYRVPSEHSIYFYAGLEFALDNGTVMAPGVSYTSFLNAEYQPHLITAGLTVKFGGAKNKNSRENMPVPVPDSYAGFIAEEIPGPYPETAADEGAAQEPESDITETEYQSLEFYVSAASKKIRENRIKEASEIIKDGLTGYPNNYEMNLMQGFCMVKLGKQEAAYRHYSEALDYNQHNSDLKATVEALKAELAAQKTLKSNTPEYYTSVAGKKIDNGDIRGASRALESGLKLFPGDYEMSLMQGFCMAQLGKKKSAYAHYRNALSLDPDNIRLRASVTELWNEIKNK